jgi:cytochrome c biogenesis protein CcmG/thiol:disulfide interchange protein DsbE
VGSRLKLVAQVLALVLVVSLFGLLGWKVTHQEGGGKLLDSVAEGEKPSAPAFALRRLDGEGELRLASLKGKVVLLNFWATWCDPCKRELPRLQDAWARYRDEDVAFVGIDVQDFEDDARSAVARYGLTYPNLYDGANRVLPRYGGLPLPKTFAIDRRGRIVELHLGELENADIAALVDRARSAA